MGGLYGPFTPASLAEALRSTGLRVLKVDVDESDNSQIRRGRLVGSVFP